MNKILLSHRARRDRRDDPKKAYQYGQCFWVEENCAFSVNPVTSSAAGERKNRCLSQSPQRSQRRPKPERSVRPRFLHFQEIYSFPVSSASHSAAGERRSFAS
jgi:hypothetical protein